MMEQSEISAGAIIHPNIATALAAAQSEMEGAKKNGTNPHLKRKYAELSDVIDAAMPALNRHGIAVAQMPAQVGDGWVVITRLVHGHSGESIEAPVPLLIGKSDMQGFGSAMTYARRYGLMALAGVAPEDDDGVKAVEHAPKHEARRNDLPPVDARTVADRIITHIRRTKNLDELVAAWKGAQSDLAVIRKQAPEAYAQCEAEKDTLKDALTPAPAPDLGDGEIPY